MSRKHADYSWSKARKEMSLAESNIDQNVISHASRNMQG